jgi:hypothetical protein
MKKISKPGDKLKGSLHPISKYSPKMSNSLKDNTQRNYPK